MEKTLKLLWIRCWQILVVGLIILNISSCSEQNSEVSFGFLLHSTENSRWQRDIEYLKEYSDELGIEFILCDAKGDENLQLKQASELLEKGVDALIVVAANQNTAAGIVREAHEYDTPVIAYDRLIKNSDLDYLMSFEYEEVGALLVGYVAERKPGAKCILLWGDANDNNAIFVKNGAENAMDNLSGNQKLKVNYQTYVESWRKEVAYKKMTRVLDFSNEKVDAVIACNVPLALGAVNALKEHGFDPGDVIVTGQDVTEDFVAALLKGEMQMSIVKPLDKLARGAIDLVVALTNGDKIEFKQTVNNGRINVPAILFKPEVVDLSNYKEILVEKDIYTEDEINALALKIASESVNALALN